jgi:hypothetical protein
MRTVIFASTIAICIAFGDLSTDTLWPCGVLALLFLLDVTDRVRRR